MWKIRLVKTPQLLKWLFFKKTWEVKSSKKEVFLSFDDGPCPEVTDFVLDQLALYQAKATFFCVGDNIRKHPAVFQRITQQGHQVANHTYHHLHCYKHKLKDYLNNIALTEQALGKHTNKLFRPPYGRICPKVTQKLFQQGYKIVMWDVLSRDFDTSTTVEDCINNVLKHTKPGSIIVFHDSIKTYPLLKKALPVILKELNQKGYIFSSIEN